MALNTFCFCMLVAFIFWVATMGDKAKAGHGGANGDLPHGMPAMAGGSQSLDNQKG
jgi:tetrahydromethanopterin S-methyltransferase subunit E